MPRIRTVKPEFWTHPVMGRASDGAKCLALALLNWADDEGYFQADAALVRNFARPLDVTPDLTAALIEEVRCAEWIEIRTHPLYGPLGWVVKFKKHQVVNKPRKSSLKAYFDQGTAASGPVPTPIPDDSRTTTVRKGMEGNGKEENKSSNARAREEEPAAAAAWDPELLAELRTAFGITELTDNDFAGLLRSALRFPKEQREAAARAFLARGCAEAGKGYGYLLKMIEGGANEKQRREGGAVIEIVQDFGPAGRRML